MAAGPVWLRLSEPVSLASLLGGLLLASASVCALHCRQVSVASVSCPGPNLAKTDHRASTLIRGPRGSRVGLTSLKGTDHPSE